MNLKKWWKKTPPEQLPVKSNGKLDIPALSKVDFDFSNEKDKNDLQISASAVLKELNDSFNSNEKVSFWTMFKRAWKTANQAAAQQQIDQHKKLSDGTQHGTEKKD